MYIWRRCSSGASLLRSDLDNWLSRCDGAFALTSEEVITTPIGSITNWTGTTALTASVTPTVPEPSTILLLGTGMLIVAGRQWRKGKK